MQRDQGTESALADPFPTDPVWARRVGTSALASVEDPGVGRTDLPDALARFHLGLDETSVEPMLALRLQQGMLPLQVVGHELPPAIEFYDRVFALDINFADVTERLRELR